MAQGSPQKLMKSYELQSLESVFFKLCYNDEEKVKDLIDTDLETSEDKLITNEDIIAENTKNETSKIDSFGALLYKNMFVLRRHFSFMAFQTFLPLVRSY